MINLKKELPDIPDKEVKKVKSILTQEDVNELFEYRDGDLYWKIDIYVRDCHKKPRIKIGDKAGCVNYYRIFNKSYKEICYKRKNYKTSRLIFLMFNGYLPEYVVYKDGNTLNTRIENLLEANISQAHYRKNKYSNNKTGFRGIHFNKKCNKYRAVIKKNYKSIYLGFYDTAEEANKAYLEAKEKYYGDFINKCNN